LPLQPFTIEHFEAYAALCVFDDGSKRGLEDWQLELAGDLFEGFARNLWIIPEGNGKSTLVSLLALYGADYSDSPWIPIGAAAAKQARIIHDQATGFIERTPGMQKRFRSFGGYRLIRVLDTDARRKRGWSTGIGIEVFAHDPKTGDGVIPYPFALLDELHRHPDMRLWDLWGGKLRKRNGQLLGISTAGEPETPFEDLRDEVRRRATERKRTGAHLRAAAAGEVMHEWMVSKDDECSDMKLVKAANPLSTITVATLAEDFALVNDLGDWKRLKCNRPTRSVISAITDKEWDDAETTARIPEQAPIDLGLDVAFKWDTTAMVPLWIGPKFRLLGPTRILVPPRDGSSMHPDVIKDAMLEIGADYRIDTVVMDMSRAEDIAAWIEDEMGVTVIDRDQGNKHAVADYNAFMDGLRNGTVKHTGDAGLRSHVLHAIARKLPGGDYRFDRHSTVRQNVREQDRRVIDALTAAAMVVENSSRAPAKVSVYEERFATT
jgi:hypothetical protein